MTLPTEARILDVLAQYFPSQHESLLLGRGDDCAVLRPENNLCVSTDLFLEDTHFRRTYFSPEDIGHKALAVNISDLAAMGVRPLGFTLGLGLPKDIDMTWLKRFFQGMANLATEHDMVLAGGDMSRASAVYICITVWGENPKGSSYLTRGGAMPGDKLFLVGNVGLARVGLAVLEASGKNAQKMWPMACSAHLRPMPQVNAGRILARSVLHTRPPVLMDVSDGLVRDLPRLLGIDTEENTPAHKGTLGAEVHLTESFLHPELIAYAHEQEHSAILEAWLGGEDYALLGACAPDIFSALHTAVPALRTLGTVTDTGRILLNGTPPPVTSMGFDHFGE